MVAPAVHLYMTRTNKGIFKDAGEPRVLFLLHTIIYLNIIINLLCRTVFYLYVLFIIFLSARRADITFCCRPKSNQKCDDYNTLSPISLQRRLFTLTSISSAISEIFFSISFILRLSNISLRQINTKPSSSFVITCL